MDIKQLKIHGSSFSPKVTLDSILTNDGTASAIDTQIEQNSGKLATSGAVYDFAVGGFIKGENALDYGKGGTWWPLLPFSTTVAKNNKDFIVGGGVYDYAVYDVKKSGNALVYSKGDNASNKIVDIDTTVANNSANLVTSGAVYTAIQNARPQDVVTSVNHTQGQEGETGKITYSKNGSTTNVIQIDKEVAMSWNLVYNGAVQYALTLLNNNLSDSIRSVAESIPSTVSSAVDQAMQSSGFLDLTPLKTNGGRCKNINPTEENRIDLNNYTSAGTYVISLSSLFQYLDNIPEGESGANAKFIVNVNTINPERGSFGTQMMIVNHTNKVNLWIRAFRPIESEENPGEWSMYFNEWECVNNANDCVLYSAYSTRYSEGWGHTSMNIKADVDYRGIFQKYITFISWSTVATSDIPTTATFLLTVSSSGATLEKIAGTYSGNITGYFKSLGDSSYSTYDDPWNEPSKIHVKLYADHDGYMYITNIALSNTYSRDHEQYITNNDDDLTGFTEIQLSPIPLKIMPYNYHSLYYNGRTSNGLTNVVNQTISHIDGRDNILQDFNDLITPISGESAHLRILLIGDILNTLDGTYTSYDIAIPQSYSFYNDYDNRFENVVQIYNNPSTLWTISNYEEDGSTKWEYLDIRNSDNDSMRLNIQIPESSVNGVQIPATSIHGAFIMEPTQSSLDITFSDVPGYHGQGSSGQAYGDVISISSSRAFGKIIVPKILRIGIRGYQHRWFNFDYSLGGNIEYARSYYYSNDALYTVNGHTAKKITFSESAEFPSA